MTQRITYAHIENYKGIKEITVDNLSRFVAIFGANGSGKTSFLEAIKNAIKLEKGGNDKVRIGEKNGLIEVHFEDFKIKRIIGYKGKLEVEHNGELVTRPQEWLDSIFKGVIGDPQKFLSLQRKEKVRYILDTYGKGDEFDGLESTRLKLAEERKDLHRSTLAKEEEIKEKPVIVDGEVDYNIEELESKLAEAEEHNKRLYELRSRKEKGEHHCNALEIEHNNIGKNILDKKAEIERLQKEVEQLEKDKAEVEKQKKEGDKLLKDINKEIDDFSEKDTSEIKGKISEYHASNERRAEQKAKQEIYQKNVERATELRSLWKLKDEEIKDIEQKQNQLIEAINLSYEVKVEEGNMLVNIDGDYIMLDDLNTATQLDLAVDILLNGPNDIKIMCIENANALDPNTMKKIKERIEKKKAQCFLETVYKTGYESITIEDGEIS